MKTLHVSIVALIVLVLSLAQGPGVARAGDRVVTGELVVMNAARRQFRVVEHQGSFTAPAGTALEALDGKAVQVELGGDGRVLQISEMPIHIEPITHGFEVVSGELVLGDTMMRTFSIAGDGRSFVAPHGIDIAQYAGHMVQMRLDEQGQVTDINLISRSGDAPLPRAVQPFPRSVHECVFGDASLADGSSICRGGNTFRCEDGAWVNVGTPCS